MEGDNVDIVEPIVRLKGKLIVSCQVFEGKPLYGSEYMVAMARCAVMGGAGGLRANGPQDIKAIRQVTDLPLIGIYKIHYGRL